VGATTREAPSRRPGRRDGWDGRRGQTLGPRPPLALAAAWLYALVGLVLAAFGVVGTVRDWQRSGWDALGFSLPIALYCAGLAAGAAGLRSRSPDASVSRWVCVPVVLHGLSGALGASLPIADWLGAYSLGFKEVASDTAMLGMLLGWLPALSPFCFARRGGGLLLAAFSGPIALVVAVQSVHIRL
jgi:hypothetical protein